MITNEDDKREGWEREREREREREDQPSPGLSMKEPGAFGRALQHVSNILLSFSSRPPCAACSGPLRGKEKINKHTCNSKKKKRGGTIPSVYLGTHTHMQIMPKAEPFIISA